MTTRTIPLRVQLRKGALSVFCPRRLEVLDAAECMRCEHCAGLNDDPEQRALFMACLWSGDSLQLPVPGAANGETLGSLVTRPGVPAGMGEAFRLDAEASIAHAAALMAHEGVHEIVVTGQDGQPFGVVSSLDILRYLARSNGYVVAE